MTEGARQLVGELFEPLLAPASRTFLPSLGIAAIVAAMFHLWRRRSDLRGAWRTLPRFVVNPRLWRHRSTVLDLQVLILRRLLDVLGVVPVLGSAWVLATTVVRGLDRLFGAPALPALPPLGVSVAYTAVVFIAWDLSRFLLHKAMHEVPVLWQLHQVHHSAEVLTPLTFHRIHPLEAALYGVRGAVVGGLMAGVFFWLFRGQAVQLTVLGVHSVGFLLDAATGNLRHSHVWLRFGPRVEAWLLSPAQHQLHHSADPADHGCNYGTWLSAWDRVGGTLRVAGALPPKAFGLADDERNHAPDELVSVLVGPLVGIWRALRPRHLAVAAALVTIASPAHAQDAGSDDAPGEGADDTDDALDEDLEDSVIVVEGGEIPRVAGAAHYVTEKDLERYEYDDIHRVLAQVPGVYVRGEDGFGLRPNIGIRGANSDRSAKITLMEDGVLLAPAPYAAPAAYYFPMTTRLTGVEVFKGPSAIRFGPHTVGGAINLLTRPAPSSTVAALDVAAGTRSTVKLHGYAGTGGPRWGMLLEGVHLGSGGFKELDGGGPTGFQRQELMLKARVGNAPDAAVHHSLELKGGYAREHSDETYLGLSVADFEATPYRRYAASANDVMQWRRIQAVLTWSVSGRDFDVRTTAYHHSFVRDWTKLNRFAGGPDLHDLLLGPGGGQAAIFDAILRGEEDSATAEQVLQIGTNHRQFQSFGVQSVALWRAHGTAFDSQFEAGVRLHGDVVSRVHTEDPFDMRSGALVPTGGPTTTLLDADSQALAIAAHVREDLRIGQLRVLPGFRMEAIRTDRQDAGADDVAPMWQVVPLPGLGLFGSVTRWLDVFAGAHRGFSPVAPGQPEETRPETTWSYEAGGRASTADGLRAEVVGFFSDYQNLTGQCTLSGGCDETQIDRQFNGGRVFVYGIEAVFGKSLKLPHQMGLEAVVNYTWTGTSFRTGFDSAFPQFGVVTAGDELPYVPEHQGAFRVTATHPRASLTLGGNLRGPMRDLAGQGDVPDTELIPTAFMLDAALHVTVTKHVEAYTTFTNLANTAALESYRPFGARPAAPIQAMLGVKIRTL